MAKEYSIGFKFTGDTSGFVRAVGQINKNVGSLQKNVRSISSTFRTLSAITGVALSIKGISSYTREAIKLALIHGDISDAAKKTASQMTGLSETFKEIKNHIGEAILESTAFQNAISGLDRLAEKVKRRGFLSTIFESEKKWQARRDEKLRWDVDRNGNPITEVPPVIGKLKKSQEEINKALEKELALREKLGKEYEKMFTKVNMPDSFAEWGASQQKDYGGLAGGPNTSIQSTTEALSAQFGMVQNLTSAFESMFSSVGEGFDGMVNSMIESLKRWITEMLAKAAALLLIRAIFPGTAMGANATTSLMGMFGQGMFSGGGIKPSVGGLSGVGASAASPLKVIGKISGRDIYLSASRYGNMLQGGT